VVQEADFLMPAVTSASAGNEHNTPVASAIASNFIDSLSQNRCRLRPHRARRRFSFVKRKNPCAARRFRLQRVGL